MGKYFGTDGFRGEANVVLTADHAFKIGRFLGWYYGDLRRRAGEDGAPRVVIGKDTRRSSYMYEYALSAGLTASGADAYLMHVTTTPSVSFAARTESFDCGIMISASHNPYYDNGIKLISGSGEKMDEETILKVEAYLDGVTGEVPLTTRDQIGKTVDFAAGRNRYIGYLISLATRSYKGMRVGLDCANGSAWMIAKSVFDALGAKTYVIGADPDGLNINRGYGSTHMENLQRLVREEKLDVGFAFDGDADRCLCVDENGTLITGDHILYVCGKYLRDRGELPGGHITATVMSNFGFFKSLDEEGISYDKTAVGDKYVYESMSEHGWRLGGEQSGHIIFKKYATTGDGLLTAIKLMEVILETKHSLGELIKPMHFYPQVLKNVRVTSKEGAYGDPEVQTVIAEVSAEIGDAGRLLVRQSGTEPVIRVMAEADTTEACERYVRRVVEAIEKQGWSES
ncbi:MAG: phosphoglucosamine mutase [Clostridia bacterium]|nr:phosphoglucosamine mutase [Clostridia bacterium]